MANPFEQGGWDPFGDLPVASKPHTPDLQSRTSDHSAGIRPARAAPPPPGPASSNPFAQHFPSSSTQQQGDDDPFGLLSSAPAATQQPQTLSAAAAAATAGFERPPPSYSAAAELPPPPAYEDAAELPPPPSYEQAVGSSQQPCAAAAMVPARAAPAAPPGPLHAGLLPSRQPPAAPGPLPARAAPAAPGASGVMPARQAPQAPGVAGTAPARAAPPAPMPARPAPRAPPAAATSASSATSSISSGDQDWLSGAAAGGVARGAASRERVLAQQQLADLSLGSSGSSSWMSSSYTSTGNVGLAPKSGSSLQASQQQLNAQIRLPPLNPKSAAPLKLLAAGLGSLVAGPVGDAGQIFQWCPNQSSSTLPHGAQATSREDHDSAPCAELQPPRVQDSGAAGAAAGFGGVVGVGGTKGSRVSCMLVAPGPGWLWCGCTDGTVHCWGLGQDGRVARWLHGWVAHNAKVKGMAISPSGRLFTGSGTGSMKMWSYGNPAYTDASQPHLLRQLQKLEGKGISSKPHSKVIGMAISSDGRVLWSVGKNTISLWNAHNGEYLGTMSDEQLSDPYDAFAGGRPAHGYASGGGQQGTAALEISPKQGLEAGVLDSLFSQPAAELLAERDAAAEAEKDAAAVALSVAAKAGAKAGKLFGKLQNKIAAKLADEGWAAGAPVGGAGGGDYAAADHGRAGSSFASGTAGGSAVGGFDTAAAGLASKVERWGAIKKLVAADDGSMWISYKKGLLEKYSAGGQLLWNSSSTSTSTSTGTFRPGGITALAAAGSSVWVGDQEGRIWVLDTGTCNLQRSWKAHVFPVRSIAAGGLLVYSLGKAGSIRAWSALPPAAAVTAAWQQDLTDCLQQQQLQVLVGTWNVNETKPSRAGLQTWLGDRSASVQLVMVGLQEVEMGTSSVVWDMGLKLAAKDKLEAGTGAGQAWATAVADVLSTRGDWRRVGLRQMSGILVLVYARAELEPYIGEVATASVACGVMGYGGNKGAVAVSFSLFRRRVVIVSSHFAAHQEKVEARNADYSKIARHLHFHNVPTDKPQQQQQYEAADVVVVSSGDASAQQRQQQQQQSAGIGQFLARQQQHQHKHSSDADGGSPRNSPQRFNQLSGNSSSSETTSAAAAAAAAVGEEEWGAGVRDAELLVWVGDFNYRVDSPDGFEPDRMLDPEQWPVNAQLYQFVHKKIAALQHLDLLSGDQLIREMARGAIFHSLAEAPISFMPTYKFEKGRESNALQPFYDQGEKKRVPAWTDRIFFRGSGAQRSALQPNPAEQPSDVLVCLPSAQSYNSLMEVNDSDHKPVYAVLAVQLPWYEQQRQRRLSLQQLWQVAATAAAGSSSSSTGSGGSVSLSVEPQLLQLHGSYMPAYIAIHNPSRAGMCRFTIQGSGPGGALPSWLEIVPAAGVLEAGGSVRVRVQGTKAQWGVGTTCEVRVVGSLEGSRDSSGWPVASYSYSTSATVVL